MTDARPLPDDERRPDAARPAEAPGLPDGDRRTAVLVRRSPRYFRFMGVGAALGVLVAFILTLAFPDTPDFSRAQVLAFLALFGVVLLGGAGALVALILDRSATRRSRVLTAEREQGDPEA